MERSWYWHKISGHEISSKEEDATPEEDTAPMPEDMGKEADKKMQEIEVDYIYSLKFKTDSMF